MRVSGVSACWPWPSARWPRLGLGLRVVARRRGHRSCAARDRGWRASAWRSLGSRRIPALNVLVSSADIGTRAAVVVWGCVACGGIGVIRHREATSRCDSDVASIEICGRVLAAMLSFG